MPLPVYRGGGRPWRKAKVSDFVFLGIESGDRCAQYRSYTTHRIRMRCGMQIDINLAIAYIWAALGIVWLVGLAFTKRAVRSQPMGSRVFTMSLAVLGFALLGTDWFQFAWLAERFVPQTRAVAGAGLALTIAGCLFAVWARVALGRNWSGRATVKEGHELIVSGPYSLARHPIYTGLLVAVAGSALA